MSYRLLRITNFYSEYIQQIYAVHTSLKELSYDDQYSFLTTHSVEMVSSYSRSLRQKNVEAFDIITNAEPLQQTWVKEHNVSPDISFKKLIIEQIKHYQPEVLWIDDSRLFDKIWIQEIKSISNIKLIVGQICAPYNSFIADSFTSFDIMFTCIPCMKNEIFKLGVETHLLYHAFDSSILELVTEQNQSIPENELVFTGSLYTGAGFHKTRIEYIEKMIEQGIDIKLYGNIESLSKVLLKQSMYYTFNFLKGIKCESLIDSIPNLKKHKSYSEEKISYYSKKLINSIQAPVFGLDMFKVLSKSKMCFNIHGEIAGKCAGNVRLFEATGIGTCLITDWKENLSDLFEIDKEVVTYKSMDECIEKIKWLKNNPNEAKAIALAGQKRTLKDHTIENRASIIHEILSNKLK